MKYQKLKTKILILDNFEKSSKLDVVVFFYIQNLYVILASKLTLKKHSRNSFGNTIPLKYPIYF